MKFESVCVIDDDPIFIYGIKRMMKLVDFCDDLQIFENAEDALNHFTPILKSEKPDVPEVILLDLNMPIMNGWEFLDELIDLEEKLKNTKTKIYIVSSSVDPEDLNKAKEYEMVSDFIIKPVNTDLLKKLKDSLLVKQQKS